MLAKHKPLVDLDTLQGLLDNAALPSIAKEDLSERLSSRVQKLSSAVSSIMPTPLQPDSRTRLLDEL